MKAIVVLLWQRMVSGNILAKTTNDDCLLKYNRVYCTQKAVIIQSIVYIKYKAQIINQN